MSNRRNTAVDNTSTAKFSRLEQNTNALKYSADLLQSKKNSTGSESGSKDQSDQSYNISLLDDVNRKIISLLEDNVFLSQTEIAKNLGLSQSSIALRLDKLRKSGILMESAGVYLKKIGLEMCRVDASSSEPRATIEWSRSSPLFTNGSVGVGCNNVSL